MLFVIFTLQTNYVLSSVVFWAKNSKNQTQKTRKQLKIKTQIIQLIFLPKVSLHKYAHNYSWNTLFIFILILKKSVFDRCQKHKQ